MRAARLCLDDSGHGEISQVSDFAAGRVTCSGEVTANFDSQDHFVAQKPQAGCDDGLSNWRAATFICTRRNDATADCVAESGGSQVEMEFRRAP